MDNLIESFDINSIKNLSNRIIAPVISEKLASEITQSLLEKQAGSGIGAFAEALTGNKARRLKGEINDLAKDVKDKSFSPKLQEAQGAVEKIKSNISNSANHERMDEVKENLDNKRSNHLSTSTKNDAVLNHYTGIRTPLRIISPSYIKARAENAISNLGVKNAKSQYKAQQSRIENDLHNELSGANLKLNNIKKENGIGDAANNLKSKMEDLHKAESATRSSRGIVAGGVAAGTGAYLYNKNKNKANQYDYGGSYGKFANEANTVDAVEKLANEMIMNIVEK